MPASYVLSILYSFAIVLFFTDHVKETSVEAIMRRCLPIKGCQLTIFNGQTMLFE